jgi:hypothetical protein
VPRSELVAAARRLLPGLLVNAVGATTVYFGLAHWWRPGAPALAVAAGVPVAWTLARYAVRRAVDPVGVVVAAGYGLAVLVSVLTDGSPLALELHEPALTGLLGLACLLSLVVRRPLHGVLCAALSHRAGDSPPAPAGRLSYVVTALVGGTLVVHAGTLLALALTVPVDRYLLLRHLVGLPILALGGAALAWYRQRIRTPSRTRRSG